jgi:predicted ATP-grasp superfamily ATP-dependent carboligase
VGRWVVKPLAGGGGVGVRFAEPGAPAPPGCRLERYVEGTPGSVFFVAAGGEAVALGVTEQVTGMPELAAPGFAYAGNILYGDPRPLQPLCDALAAWFGMVGLNGVDFVVTPDGPVVLEVNPRWTASMELWEQATGESLVALHVAAVCGGELPVRLPPVEGAWGKAILYGERPGIWRFHGDWRDFGLCDVPAAGAPVLPGRPVCTVLASGDTVSEVRERLAAKARRVRREWLG